MINCAIGYGYFISATFKSQQAATNAAPLFLIPTLLFGGFFINSSSIPAAVAWLRFCTPIYYGFQALCIVQWKSQSAENPAAAEALDFLVDKPDEYWNNIYAMCMIVLAWRLAAYFMLRWNIDKFQ